MSFMLQIQTPSLPLFTSSLVVLVILVIYWRKRLIKIHSAPITLRLPPGPWKLPLIGNLHQLVMGASAGSLPHHALRDLAEKYGPLMHLKLGQVSTIVISSSELSQEVMKTRHETVFSQRPTVVAMEVVSYNKSGLIFCPDNDYWKQMRKLCVLELLSAKRVRSFSSIREEEAWNLVQSIHLSSQVRQPINLGEKIFSMQNSNIARAALGLKKCKYQQEFISLIKQLSLLSGGFGVLDLFPSLKFLGYVTNSKLAIEKVHRKIDKILEEVINDHKVKRKATACTTSNGHSTKDLSGGDQLDDIVDVLLQLQESGELQFDLTTNNIKAIILDMYAAGTEPLGITTEWAMSELLRHPRAMEKAQAEVRQLLGGKRKIEEADLKKLDYLKLVIKETLRLHPPLPLIPRMATRTCKVRGYDIPTKAKVFINVWAIMRDPKVWDNSPECFVPERFQGSSIDFLGTNFELIPFGGGKRICPGISFGIASVELALSVLLCHFNWELPNGTKLEELDMTETGGISNRRKNDLFAIPIPFIP